MSSSDKLERLFNILNAEEIQRAFWQSGLDEFSAEDRNALVARLVRNSGTALQGRLVGRLLFIATDENKPDMMAIFRDNLHSADPVARKASLYGLEKLGHPSIVDFAVASLQDSDDQVVTEACRILLPRAMQDPRLRQNLQEVYAANKGKSEFHMSTALLASHLERR
jgi:hypothetical protein